MSSEQLLWSDERIIAEVDDALWEADSESRERARRLLRQVRDDYAARLRTVEQERDAALYALMLHNPTALAGDILAWVHEGKQRIEALQAELEALAQWEPVTEYSYTEHLNMGSGKPSKWQRVEVRGRMITIDRDDTGMHAALLPQDMGVFRRKPTEGDSNVKA